MRTEKVTCDGCGHDLTTRTNMVDYRLVLEAEGKPGHGPGFYHAMHISPPVDRTYHFCGLPCLDLWRDRERHLAGLWNVWGETWRDEHGSKDETGRIRSWTSPPDDVHAAKKSEFEAAALAAFPMERPKRR